MNIAESMKMAFSAIRSNKMRSLLTMLGIIIGISSVIALVTLGNGSKAMMTKEFSAYGANRATVYLSDDDEETSEDIYTYLVTENDIEMIERIYGDKLEGVSAMDGFMGSVAKGRKSYNVTFNGVSASYNKIDNLTLEEGRFFTKEDVENERQVVVIEKKMLEGYYDGTSPVGQVITVDVNGQSETFRIIGVYSKPPSNFQQESDLSFNAFTPISIGARINETEGYGGLEINVKKGYDVKETSNSIISILERTHDAKGKNVYRVFTMESQLKMMSKFTGTITTFVAAIAAISLLVGGIGIMNIMLVSVTERTREIGIRKAIGAKKKDILSQFMIESIIVSGIGGVIGIIMGIGFAMIGTGLMKVPLTVDPGVVMFAFLFSAMIGVFFGIYPANKAAKLNTIDALRYE